MISKKIIKILEYTLIILVLLTIISVFSNVVLRYVFNDSLIAMQELQWHFYSALFLLGISYTTYYDKQVRVDVLYQNFNTKTKNIINIIGIIIFIIPISISIVYYGYDFSYQSYELAEKSSDPGGLDYRFIIKAVIPLAFIALIISCYYSLKKLISHSKK